MKLIKYIFISIQLFYLSIECNSQINQLAHEKYWFYRKRLVNEFLVSGEQNTNFTSIKEEDDPGIPGDQRQRLKGCGLSIPMHGIIYSSRENDIKELKFSESPSVLGDYIAVLATELRLLYDYGQPYENTKRELYYTYTPIPLKGGYNCFTTPLLPLALLFKEGWEVNPYNNITHPKHHQL